MNDDEKPTNNKLPSLLHHIFNADSRKVGFGWWVFIVATALLAHLHVISAEQWMECVMLSTALIGGGTIMDTYLGGKFKSPAPPVKEKPDAAVPAPPANP